jgi:hypothetical protein
LTPSPSPALPGGEALRDAEAHARAEGTGLEAADLTGLWCFHQVWPRDGGAPQAAASGLLRALQGSLEIGPAMAVGAMGEAGVLPLRNRVRIGLLELVFEGEGELVGRRPLLRFWFHRWQLRLGDRVLLERLLVRPAPRALPFFALIARGSDGGGGAWLAARGRGGGLALWRLAAAAGSADPAGQEQEATP